MSRKFLKTLSITKFDKIFVAEKGDGDFDRCSAFLLSNSSIHGKIR